MTALEVVAALISAAGVWLVARRSVRAWPVSLVGVALYGWIFFTAKLYSDMLLQAFFGASCVYGWLRWNERSDETGTVTVATPSRRELALGALAGAAGALALGAVMAGHTDASVPWLDAALTSFSLVAQVWTTRRFIASWWLWIGVDVVYVGLFLQKALYPTAALYAGFLAICAVGLADWRRAARG